MGKVLDAVIRNRTHPFNPKIAEGVSTFQLENAEAYIDNAFKLNAASFPEGLVYEGYRRCTVQEEYNSIVQSKGQSKQVELAPSNVYMVNYYFSWKGEKLPPRQIYVPYVGKAGLLYLHGKRFTVLPVLADETLSVAKGDIFVPFLSAKVTFKRNQYWFKIDGAHNTHYLVWSKIYNHNVRNQPRRSSRADLSVRCNHTMAHYLFCKYGVKGTFMKYCGVDPIIVEGPVSEKEYPREHWAICSSSQIKPKNVKLREGYTPTEIKLILPRDSINNDGIKGLLTGFFYVVDHYAHRIKGEYLDNSVDEIRLWRILLGHAVFLNKLSEGELYLKMNEHFESLDHYVDDMTREGLSAHGYDVDNLYDLMMLLISDFTQILLDTNPASLYGKSLAVSRYVLADIVKGISLFKFEVNRIKNRELTTGDINRYLARFLKTDIIFSNLNKHNEIVSIQCAGDNIMFNYTSRLILQEGATGSSKGKQSGSFKDPAKFLHASIAECGSILALPKAEPIGRTVLNPYATVDSSFKLKRNPALKPMIDAISKTIDRDKRVKQPGIKPNTVYAE